MDLPPQFPLSINLRWVAPRRGIFVAPFAFLSERVGTVMIEVGFDTDFASVPRGLWNLYPPDGDYSPAAFIHDALYWHQSTSETGGRPVTRAEADAVFLEAMTALGIGWVTRSILYRAVRLGGGKAWAANARAQASQVSGLSPQVSASPEHIKKHFHKLRH